MLTTFKTHLLRTISLISITSIGFAEEATKEVIDKGDTAMMILASALVLFMTLPGLALFYGGLVRSKNILSIMAQCFALAGVMSILWIVCGYSLAFGEGNAFIGGTEFMFLKGIGPDSIKGTIPHILFIMFQMTFFIITPVLIIGGFAERMKFSAMLIFCALWGLLSYLPICHMAWTEGGFFETRGVLDFAGGTVVHINAGIAALAAAIMVGKRKDYMKTPIKPHNLTMTAMGTAMLWVGWFGFNAGSELAADGTAAMAMIVTHICAAVGAVTWMAIEWVRHGKPSLLGIASGAVAGLVCITPACGTTGILGAFILGICGAFAGYLGVAWLKFKFGYDDTLDAFGIHGVVGIVGAILTGVFADQSLGGSGISEVNSGIGEQVYQQTVSVIVTIIWSAVVSFGLLFILKKTIGLRVSEEDESKGLDIATHEEQGYLL